MRIFEKKGPYKNSDTKYHLSPLILRNVPNNLAQIYSIDNIKDIKIISENRKNANFLLINALKCDYFH